MVQCVHTGGVASHQLDDEREVRLGVLAAHLEGDLGVGELCQRDHRGLDVEQLMSGIGTIGEHLRRDALRIRIDPLLGGEEGDSVTQLPNADVLLSGEVEANVEALQLELLHAQCCDLERHVE